MADFPPGLLWQGAYYGFSDQTLLPTKRSVTDMEGVLVYVSDAADLRTNCGRSLLRSSLRYMVTIHAAVIFRSSSQPDSARSKCVANKSRECDNFFYTVLWMVGSSAKIDREANRRR